LTALIATCSVMWAPRTEYVALADSLTVAFAALSACTVAVFTSPSPSCAEAVREVKV
jgi:hypothetical protein